MSDQQAHAKLNDLLIAVGRSLLQYTCEAWPWTDANTASIQCEIEQLAERQSQLVADIADWLSQQQWPVDYGVYSADFTDLHYVALSYLMGEIVRDADEVSAKVESVHGRYADHADVGPLMKHILAEQNAITAKLHELAKAENSGQAA